MKRVLPITVGITYSLLFSSYYCVAARYGKVLPPEAIISWLLYYPTLIMGSLLFFHIGRIDNSIFYRWGVFYPIAYFFASVFFAYLLNDIYTPTMPLNKVVYGSIGMVTLSVGIPTLIRLIPWFKTNLNKLTVAYKKIGSWIQR